MRKVAGYTPLLRPLPLVAGIASVLTPAVGWAAPDVVFNPDFLQGAGAQAVDLSRFERGEDLPGVYSADIRVNGTIVGRREVEVRSDAKGGSALCLSGELLELAGLDQARLPVDGAVDADGTPVVVRPLPDGRFCDDLNQFVPDATARLDAGEQILDVSIPQAYLLGNPRGWVSPASWDAGIPAGRLAYSVVHQQVQSQGRSRQFSSATLSTGVNWSGWRLRHDGFFSKASASPARYRAGRTYAQRVLVAMGAELTLGEASTFGDLFESVNYRGANISTDPRMLPDSQRDYAPVVRGTAQSNAQVIIRQRDQVLYQTTAAPGPFEINDLYGTAYAGDLDVEVVESDGRVQHFVVPFAAVPQLLRAGQQRYSFTAGTLDDPWARRHPAFFEATMRRGLDNRLTGYGGVIGADEYAAALMGAAINTTVGAFATDITASHASIAKRLRARDRRLQGQSVRFAYSKDIPKTQTSITMAALRYSSAGYLTLNDAARLRDQYEQGGDGSSVARQRSRLDLNVNQRLGERGGSLYVNGNSVSYWNLRRRQINYSVGYSNTFRSASYSISAQRNVERNLFGDTTARQSNSISFNLSMPLGQAPSAPRFNGIVTRGSDDRNETRAGIDGNFGAQRQGNYSASASRAGGAGSIDANVGYQAPAVNLSVGYSQSRRSRGITAGASGGVLLHEDGITLAQQLGETVGIVEVPGARGARIDSSVGVKTNGDGLAVVPYLQPYHRNEIAVDPLGLPLDVELKSASALAVPMAGAVVKLLVPTTVGRSALIEAPRADGQPLPFGVDVYDSHGKVVGIVGQASRLWVRGLDERGALRVQWGKDADQVCSITYHLDATDPEAPLAGTCLPVNEGAGVEQ